MDEKSRIHTAIAYKWISHINRTLHLHLHVLYVIFPMRVGIVRNAIIGMEVSSNPWRRRLCGTSKVLVFLSSCAFIPSHPILDYESHSFFPLFFAIVIIFFTRIFHCTSTRLLFRSIGMAHLRENASDCAMLAISSPNFA